MAVTEARTEPGERAGERFEAFYVREYHGVVRLAYAYALSGSRLPAWACLATLCSASWVTR